jgi:hypothetical protein
MDDRKSWRWCLLTGAIIAVFVFFLFDELLDVIWPEPVIGLWILSFF